MEILIPIVMFIVLGIVMVTYFYLTSRERQMLIDRSLSPEQITAIYGKKKNGYLFLKLGILTIAIGIGFGLGFWVQSLTDLDEWMAIFIILSVGIGFVTSYYFVEKIERDKAKNN